MTCYILDTDHLTLLKRNNDKVNAKVASIPSKDIFVTIITVEEQLRGRLAIISKVQYCLRILFSKPHGFSHI
jgi:tRNA(fMet)-specific endonuclease VapC